MTKLERVPFRADMVTVVEPRLSSRKLAERDYSRLELADMAREFAAMEREVRRNTEAARRAAHLGRLSATAVIRTTEPRELATMARKAGASVADAKAASDMLAAAADMGMTPEELTEGVAIERALMAEAPSKRDRIKAEAGQRSELSAEARAEVARWTRAMHESEAAQVGRAALDTMGPRIAAVVSSRIDGGHVTVSRVVTVRDMERAASKLASVTSRYAKAVAKVQDMERHAKSLTGDARRDAIRRADQLADTAAKLASKMSAAWDTAVALGVSADLPDADGFIAVPVATFDIADVVAEAWQLDIPERKDRMPRGFIESGPSVNSARTVSGRGHVGSAAHGVSDPTGDSAAALADGYRSTVAEIQARETALESRFLPTMTKAEAQELRRTEYKARRAMAARERRRNAKARNN